MGREKKFVQTVQVTWPRWPPRPHMVKILKKSSQEQKGRWPWKLVCCAGCSSITKFFQIMTLRWPWPILWQGQIWSLMLLYGKKINNGFFRNCCSLSYQGWEMWLTKWIYINIKGQDHSLILVSQGEKSTWSDWDSNPGPIACRESTLTTELPSYTVDLWQFPPA